MSISDIWNYKSTPFFGHTLSLSHIPQNIARHVTPLRLLALAGVGIAYTYAQNQNVETRAVSSPECEALLQELQAKGMAYGKLIFTLLRSNCMQLVNQVTGVPLSVADENGVCADPQNCVSLGADGAGLNIQVWTLPRTEL